MRLHYAPILAALLLWPVVPARAGGADDRVLRTIDFEERALGNVEDTPMYWTKVQGPGLPHYVTGKLASDRARSGRYSFRFDLNGGSVIYRYTARLRISAGSHYRVETYAQTTPLQHARAQLAAGFLDADGRPIGPGLRRSEPWAATESSEIWKQLAVEISADNDADMLVVELQLLQPELYSPAVLGHQTIFPQDIRGSVWFDDVAIAQIPKVTITTGRPGNIFPAGAAAALGVTINDRFTDDLAAQLVMRDAAGAMVYQRSGALDIAAGRRLADGSLGMTIPLPPLPPGWYQAALVMSSRGRPIARQATDLILLADATETRPDGRFGVDAAALPLDFWPELPGFLPLLGTGRVKLAVWSAQADVPATMSRSFDELLIDLKDRGITPTACLVDVPPAVAQRIGGGSWRRLTEVPPEMWQADLATTLARHANHLDRWQMGLDGSDAFVTDAHMRRAYDLVHREFAKLVQHPDLAMPWPAWHELPADLPPTVALSVPASVLPSQLPLYMQDLRGSGHNLSLSLQLLDGRYGREVRIRDLAQRTLYALAAGATRLDFPLPLEVVTLDDGQRLCRPTEMALILRTLATTLAGCEFRGRVPLAEGVEAFLFERSGQFLLALWDKGLTGSTRQLALGLGAAPRAVDLWGNVTPLVRPQIRPTEQGRLQPVNLAIGPMPIFLVDIDGLLAQLRASVAIDRPLLESSFRPHTRTLRFTNPYPTALAGTVKLRGPEGWSLKPPVLSFNLNPGETIQRDVTIEFPYNSLAGAKTLEAIFDLPDTRAGSTTVPLTLHLGLSEVGMQTLGVREGREILVQQIITNYGDRPIDYTAFAAFPGLPREERLVVALAPGKSSVKLYRFPTPPDGRPVVVRVGVKEMSGTRILNAEVEVP